MKKISIILAVIGLLASCEAPSKTVMDLQENNPEYKVYRVGETNHYILYNDTSIKDVWINGPGEILSIVKIK